MLLSILACAICIYGALRMRSLRKSGFSVYLVGEVLPIIVSVIFLGFASFSGFMMAMSLIFPVVFIILYATQLKNLG
jgi:tryptophan-rich sensory protein